MENERFTMKEATALLVAARCHRETLEGVYSAMVRHGERGLPGARCWQRRSRPWPARKRNCRR